MKFHRSGVLVALAALVALPAASVQADPLPGGTFEAYAAFAPGPAYEAVTTGHLNADSTVDVAATAPGQLLVFAGDGAGGLGAPVVHPLVGYTARSVAAGDINGDGRDDLAVTTRSQVELFTQTATGTMTSAGALTVEAEKVRIADVTSDGRADVVVLGWDRDAVSVYPQTSAGTLASPANYNVPLSGYNDLEVADVDGDGDNDIVAMSGQLYATPDLTVLVQSPGGMAVRSYSLPGDSVNANGVGVGDVDGDGLGEVIVSHGGNIPASKVTVFEAAADGSLSVGATIGVYDIPEPVEVADVDGDGFDDVVVAHGGWYRISVLYGSAAGLGPVAEALSAPYASHYDPHGLVASDLDGDGDDELVVADYNNGILRYRNRGTAASVADLSLALASPTTAKANVAFTQSLTVSNQGNVAMSGTVRLDLPTLLRIQSSSGPACTVAGQSLTCAVPSLAPGSGYGVSVTVKATKTGSATTRAALTSTSSPDADPSDDTATASVTITRK